MQTLSLTPAQFKAILGGSQVTADLEIETELGEVIYLAERHTVKSVDEDANAVTVAFTTPAQEVTFENCTDKVIIEALKRVGKKSKAKALHPSLCRVAVRVEAVDGDLVTLSRYSQRTA